MTATAYMEMTDNFGICFSVKERNFIGVALILLLSPMETASLVHAS